MVQRMVNCRIFLLICNEFMACYGTENGPLPHIFMKIFFAAFNLFIPI